MKEFKSNIWNSSFTFLVLTIPISTIAFLTLFLTLNIKLTDIDISIWFLIIICYLIVAYIYIGLTNNNVLVYDQRLEIKNNVPLFRKLIEYKFDDIKLVTFRHEWTETFGRNIKPNFLKYIIKEWLVSFVFPWDYKWIKIKADKDYKYCCFGLSMDYYDNDEILFEDLFYELGKKGIKVAWTDITEIYYKQMTENIEQLQSAIEKPSSQH